MIINGSSNRCVWWWTQHLESEDNDKVRVADSYGLRSENIHDMLCEMEAMATGTRCQNFFYQMNMNPGPGEHLTEKEWEQAREIAEKKHGLEGQPYFMVMHVKYGREHPHFIYSRIDRETMRAISDGNDARKNHAIAREIEWKLGLQKVIGPYDREPGTPRPPRAPKKYEMYRDKQNGLDTRDITAEVTELFQQSHSGPEFKAALEGHGYELVTGRRGLLILDTAGNEHSLARRSGITMKEMDAFMRDVDRQALPTVEQGKAMHQDRKIAALEADCETVKHEIEWEEALAKAAIEKEKIEGRFIAPEDREKETRAGRLEKEPAQQQPEPVYTSPVDHFKDAGLEMAGATGPEKPLQGMEKKLWDAYRSGPNATDLAATLDAQGIAFARVTGDEADKSYREAQFAKAVERTAPVYRAGEIVVVREPGLEYQRNGEWTATHRVHRLDQAHAEKYLEVLSIDKPKLKGIDATKAILETSAQDRAAYWEEIRLERATDINRFAPVRSAKETTAALGNLGGLAIGAAFSLGENILDGLFALLDPPMTPLQRHQAAEKARDEREAQAEHQIDFSKYTADRAQERQNHQDQQAGRDRQSELERER